METDLSDDEIVYSGEIDYNDLTFMERYVWANLGWVFIEASFRLPNWTFRFAGVCGCTRSGINSMSWHLIAGGS